MNRTDRLYALVEDLRAVAPGRRTARELAGRYEVSVRTIERDISALQQSGVPIYADVGRTGGYTLDKRMSLPPLNFSPAEVVAMGVALRRMRGTPFDAAGAAALAKIVAALSDASAGAARALAERVRVVEAVAEPDSGACAGVVNEAIVERRVIRMSYADRFGVVTERCVEPMALMCGGEGWYLVGWCRLRGDARVFRLDRITGAELGERAVVARRWRQFDDLPADRIVRTVAL
ncbi:helix-turn-helix transcriptional regulator [Nocardia pseudobrasiliensis]|uniref:HTH domain-containing protein n=1 Tax=Nocardia pseudobrasiliensis TaxID=45979 RepID=A0A370HQ76_9NOCA|nr:WYL domain-containing protein [Nocardia pseudobrasiliensis]RDI59054.1 HTH domain-containing protein [Nocardia pseudobrasiliensis]